MELLVITAFVGGVLMFLAPCTLPLVPAFLASLIPHKEQGLKPAVINHRTFIIPSLYFTLGFTTIFVLFGVLVGVFGDTLTEYKTLLGQIGGVVVILFGLSLLNIFRTPLFKRSFSLVQRLKISRGQSMTPGLLGVLFALGWAPCAGPVLASILILSSQSGTILQGGLLLLVFSLGLSIPFLLVGYFYSYLHIFLSAYGKYTRFIQYISGFFLVGLGVVLTFGQYIVLTRLGFSVYTFFGYVPSCSLM